MKQILFIAFTIGVSLGLPPHKGRIYGGNNASPGQFPFAASINNPEQLCDGAIINKNWIVTAAHCIDYVTPNSVILVGTTLQHSGGTKYDVLQKIPHENFSWSTLKDDIALIQIKNEFEFTDFVQPVEFGQPEVNATCTALGWGATESVQFSEELEYVELTALRFDDCRNFNGAFMYLGPEQVCAVGNKGEGVCNGDSGGPLVCGGKLSGIVSYGTGSCGQGLPDVYTSPFAYVDWINKHIEQNVSNTIV